MKTVRLRNNVVQEIIPEYALPAAEWYGEDFAAQCVEAPDEVDQRWVYDPAAGTFSEPREPEPAAKPLTNEEITEILKSMTGKE